MRSIQEPSKFYIATTLFIALFLILLPLPFQSVMPNFLLLVLLSWIARKPSMLGVGVAWLLGLITDLAQGSLLGMHAMIYTVIAYCVIKFLPRFNAFPVWQQSMIIFVLVMFHSALQYWIMSIGGIRPDSWTYWLPAVSSMVVWPLIWKIY